MTLRPGNANVQSAVLKAAARPELWEAVLRTRNTTDTTDGSNTTDGGNSGKRVAEVADLPPATLKHLQHTPTPIITNQGWDFFRSANYWNRVKAYFAIQRLQSLHVSDKARLAPSRTKVAGSPCKQ
ncbi:MAG: hypothetical protein OXI96_08465 [Acidimicrobiaceae bacterium]|nr:hypothetical protein [Acidimicrobiaceae bacterium]